MSRRRINHGYEPSLPIRQYDIREYAQCECVLPICEYRLISVDDPLQNCRFRVKLCNQYIRNELSRRVENDKSDSKFKFKEKVSDIVEDAVKFFVVVPGLEPIWWYRYNNRSILTQPVSIHYLKRPFVFNHYFLKDIIAFYLKTPRSHEYDALKYSIAKCLEKWVKDMFQYKKYKTASAKISDSIHYFYDSYSKEESEIAINQILLHILNNEKNATN